jgi:pyrroline-5-carboxylate reductase
VRPSRAQVFEWLWITATLVLIGTGVIGSGPTWIYIVAAGMAAMALVYAFARDRRRGDHWF